MLLAAVRSANNWAARDYVTDWLVHLYESDYVAKLWPALSLLPHVRSCTTLTTFRKHLKSHLFQSSFPTA